MGFKRLVAVLLAGLYALAGLAWVAWSDGLLQELLPDARMLTRYQTYKGWGYVILSSVLVYALVRAGQHAIRVRDEAHRRQREAEHRLSKIADALPSALYIYQRWPDGRHAFPYVSAPVERVFGLAPEVLRADATPFFARLHPGDVGRVQESTRRANETRQPWREEMRLRDAAGAERWFEGYASGEAQPDGSIVWYGSLRDITERKRAEQDLREREARLRLAQEAAKFGTWTHDVTTGRRHVDVIAQAHYALPPRSWETGYQLAEIMARVHPGDQARVHEAARMALHKGPGDDRHRTEFRVVREDGSIRWIVQRSQVHFRGEGDQAVAVLRVGTTQDITQHRQAEALRQQDEEYLRLAYEAAGMGAWRHDLETDTLWGDARALQLFGLRTQELSRAQFLAHVHPDDLPGLRAKVEAALAADADGHYQAEYRIIGDDGQLRWVTVAARVYFNGEGAQRKAVLRLGTVQEITARKRAEQALIDSEARANLILDTVPEAMLLVDARGTIVRANAAANRTFGYAGDELLHRPVEELVPLQHRRAHRSLRQDYLQEAVARPMGKNRLLFARRRDGREFPAEISLGPLQVDGQTHVIVTILDVSERRLAELQLERFGQIVETSGDMLALVDRECRYQLGNSAYAKFHGLTPTALQGLHASQLWSAQAWRQIEPELSAALRGHEQRTTITEARGEGQCFLEADYRPFRDQYEVRGVVISIRDVTPRVLAMRAMVESEQTLARAQSLAKVGSWTYDVATAMFHRSTEASRLIGITQTEVPYSVVKRNWHPDDAERVERAWQAAQESGTYEIEHRLLIDGQVKWMHARAEFVFDAAGHPLKAYGVTQDVTETREAQLALQAHQQQLEKLVAARTDELRQQTRYLRTLIDTFPFLVWLKDPASRFVAVNRALADALGVPLQDVPGKCDRDFFDAATAAANIAQDRAVMESRRAATIEQELPQAGRTVWVEIFKAPIIDDDGSVLGTAGFARDVTERRAVERAREQVLAETMRLARARSEFLANMSHEIRTPLNAMLGLAQVGMRTSPVENLRTTFAHIVDSGQLLLGILNDILDYAKIEAGKLAVEHERFDLSQVIDRAVNLAAITAYPKGLAFNVQEAGDLPARCVGDALRLSQVLMNLLSNAVKFTSSGTVTLAVRQDGEALIFDVSDTGIGMSEAQLERIFRPFEQADSSTTRRFGGTGLGLAITKHLVDAMDGSIHAYSSPGGGSRFEVRIPLRAAQAASAPQSLRFALVGLPAAESAAAAAALGQRGMRVDTLDLAAAVAAHPDLLVLDAKGLDEGAVRMVSAALERGQKAALVATPQAVPLPNPLGGRAVVLQRPLRARHLHLAATAQGEASISIAGSLRLAGLRILAAEDNELNRMVLEQMLAQEGASLVCVENGQLAVERIQTDGATAYDLLMTDIQMPVMDGYECARAIHDLAPGLPIIGLTAHAMAEERERCLTAGMSDHIAKPVDVETLVASVLRLLGRASPGASIHPVQQAGLTAIAESSDGRIIDWTLLGKRHGAKRSFVDRLVATALRTYAQVPQQLRDAVQAHDLDRIAFLAHSIKGTSANLAAGSLSALAGRCESAARNGQEHARALAVQLGTATEALLEELRTHAAQEGMAGMS